MLSYSYSPQVKDRTHTLAVNLLGSRSIKNGRVIVSAVHDLNIWRCSGLPENSDVVNVVRVDGDVIMRVQAREGARAGELVLVVTSWCPCGAIAGVVDHANYGTFAFNIMEDERRDILIGRVLATAGHVRVKKMLERSAKRAARRFNGQETVQA